MEPEVYLPQTQAAWSGGDLYVTVRATSNPIVLLPALREAVRALDPALPLIAPGTLDEIVAASVIGPKLRTLLSGAFAAVAGFLALIGVYASVNFVVVQRRRDLAIRGALGATGSTLLRGVLADGLFVATIGVLVGLVCARLAAPALGAMLYGIEPLDLLTHAGAAAAIMAAVALACLVPARRAARADLMLTLRSE
jgi:ABC-type antimicrobial peptide transport system permease subunit